MYPSSSYGIYPRFTPSPAPFTSKESTSVIFEDTTLCLFRSVCAVSSNDEVKEIIKSNPNYITYGHPQSSFQENALIILLSYERWEAANWLLDKMLEPDLIHVCYPRNIRSNVVCKLLEKAFKLEERHGQDKLWDVLLKLASFAFEDTISDANDLLKKIRSHFTIPCSPERTLGKFSELISWERLLVLCAKGDVNSIRALFEENPTIFAHQELPTLDTLFIILCRDHKWSLVVEIVKMIRKSPPHAKREYAKSIITVSTQANGSDQTPLQLVQTYLSAHPADQLAQKALSKLKMFDTYMVILNEKMGPKKPDPLYWPSFKLACENGDLEKIRADVEANKKYLITKAPLTEKTGLMLACEKGHWIVALYLIKQTKKQGYAEHLKSDKDKQGLSALVIARGTVSLEENEFRSDVIRLLIEAQGEEKIVDLAPIVLEINEKKLRGVESVSFEGPTLIFTFASIEAFQKAKKSPGISSSQIIYDQADEKVPIELQIQLKKETVKNFSKNFIKYWGKNHVENKPSSSNVEDFRFGTVHSDKKPKRESRNVTHRSNQKTSKINHKLSEKQKAIEELKKQKAEDAVKKQKEREESKKQWEAKKLEKKMAAQVAVQPRSKPKPAPKTASIVQTIQLPAQNQSVNPYADKIDDRVGTVVLRRSKEVEEISTPKTSTQAEVLLGDAQRDRLRSSLAKWLDYEIFRGKVNIYAFPYSMIEKEALMESLMQALEALYPTSDDAAVAALKNDPDEIQFQKLLAKHFISQEEGVDLRNILRSKSFLIKDIDLQKLMILFDKAEIRNKLIILLDEREAPISLKTYSIMQYVKWKGNADTQKRNQFYISQALKAIKKLKEIQAEIQLQMRQFEKENPECVMLITNLP